MNCCITIGNITNIFNLQKISDWLLHLFVDWLNATKAVRACA